MDAIGDRLFEIVARTREKVVMGALSNSAEAQFRAGVTRYFMAVAWNSADAELTRCSLAGDEPKVVMSAFLEKMHSELRRVQIAIQPPCSESDIWRMLFDDAGLYHQVWNEAITHQSEDLTLAAGVAMVRRTRALRSRVTLVLRRVHRGPHHPGRDQAPDRCCRRRDVHRRVLLNC